MTKSTKNHENMPFKIPRPYSAANDPIFLAARQQAIRLRQLQHPEFSSQKANIDAHEQVPTAISSMHSPTKSKKRKRSKEKNQVGLKLRKQGSGIFTTSEERTRNTSDVGGKMHGVENTNKEAETYSTMINRGQHRTQDPRKMMTGATLSKDKKNSDQLRKSSGKIYSSKHSTSVVRNLRPSLEAVRSADRNKEADTRSISSTSTSSDSTSSSSTSPSPSSSSLSSSSDDSTPSRPSATLNFSSIRPNQKIIATFSNGDRDCGKTETVKSKTHSTGSTTADAYWRAVSDLRQIIPPHILKAAASQMRKASIDKDEISTNNLEDLTVVFTAARNLIFLLSATNLTETSKVISNGDHDVGNTTSSGVLSQARRNMNVSLMEQQLTRIASEQSKRLEYLELEIESLKTGKK